MSVFMQSVIILCSYHARIDCHSGLSGILPARFRTNRKDCRPPESIRDCGNDMRYYL